MYGFFRAIIFALGVLPTVAQPRAHPSAAGAWAFRPIQIGGGGFVTNLIIAPDGTQLARTDTAGAFWRRSYRDKWEPAITRHSMPSQDVKPGFLYGVCEVAIAPSNTHRFYMYFAPKTSRPAPAAYVYSSNDHGATWARSEMQPNKLAHCSANDQATPSYRVNGPYMAVSPADENIVYLGTPSGGVWYSKDGAQTWIELSTSIIPASDKGSGDVGQGHLIAFDPSDANGDTAYITSYGVGVFKCINVRTSPSCRLLNSPGMPTTFKAEKVDQRGTLWIVDNTAGNGGAIERYLGQQWSTQLTVSGNPYTSLAVDPAATEYVYALLADGCVQYTVNGQSPTPKWAPCGFPHFSLSSTVIPWIPWANDKFLSANSLEFDSSQSHVLYLGSGIGVATVTPPTTGAPSTVTWNYDQTAGIENLDLNPSALALSGGGIGFAAQDRPAWFIRSPETYPARYFPDNSAIVRNGFNVCGLSSAQTFMSNNSGQGLMVSTSGYDGKYYTAGIKGLPKGFIAGACLVITNTNWLWLGSASSKLQPYFTSNGGSSWKPCTFAGGVTADGGGWQTMAQDSMTPSTVLLTNDGSGTANGVKAKGLWKNSLADGCAFTQISHSLPDPLAIYIKAVPGRGCNFIIASQAYIYNELPGQGNAYLTTNCGSTFSRAIRGVNSIIAWGIGAANPKGDGYPAFYYQGWHQTGTENTFGFWEVDNVDLIPLAHNIDETDKGYPTGNFDFIEFIVGDSTRYGTIYGGFAGSGGFYGGND